MKKNIKLEKQKKALDFLKQHGNPIIRQHAAELLGGIEVEENPICPKNPPIGYLKGLDGIRYNKAITPIDFTPTLSAQ
jgi:hypothetical protein